MIEKKLSDNDIVRIMQPSFKMTIARKKIQQLI